jgi:SAM-dependent methyltransferase
MIHQTSTPTTDRVQRAAPPPLDAALARLIDLAAAIEADCATAGLPVALPRHRAALYAAMDALGGAINAFLAGQPAASEIAAVQARVTGQIRSWSHTGPFFERSFGKLRGYPGDFETIEIIYNCRPGGATQAAQIFDDYYLWTVAARAVRNRLAYLVSRLSADLQAWAAQGVIPVRILSLGSGPGRELAQLVEDPVFHEVAAVTCVDLDAEALRFARSRINGRMNGRMNYLRENVLRFARGPNRPSQPYHIIYAAGLFDYLQPDQATRLIEDCHGLLAPGGRLIVGNFSVDLPANERVLIEWLLEWYLLYRDEADYRRIFAGTSFDVSGLHFEYEPLRGNLFAVAERG